MAFETSGNIQRFRTVFTGVAGAPYYNNLYATAGDAEAGPAVETINDFWTALAGNVASGLAWTVEGLVPDIDVATDVVVGFTSAPSHSGAGSGSGSILPPANQILISLHTGEFINGRELRGRIFVPAPIAPDNSGGVVLSAVRDLVLDAVNDNLLGSSGLNGALAVYSRTHHGYAEVMSASVGAQFAILTSRRD